MVFTRNKFFIQLFLIIKFHNLIFIKSYDLISQTHQISEFTNNAIPQQRNFSNTSINFKSSYNYDQLNLLSNNYSFQSNLEVQDQNSFQTEEKLPFSNLNVVNSENIKYVVLAPSVIKPGFVYRVVVNLFCSPEPINVMVAINRDNSEQVAGESELNIKSNTNNVILVQIPDTITKGDYHLTVTGDFKQMPIGSGTKFYYKSPLKYSENFLNILIETNQLVYNVKQSIRARIILLNNLMKPYDKPIDIFLYDAKGFVMKRWISIYPTQGMISIVFRLPGNYCKGWWKIEVQVQQQIEEKMILIERWFTEKFDVNVEMPAFINIYENKLLIKIQANYTNHLPVHANMTYKLIAKPVKNQKQIGKSLQIDYALETIELYDDFISSFDGNLSLEFPLQNFLLKLFPFELVNSELILQVVVIELYYGTVVSGFGSTRLQNSSVELRFLDNSPMVFKPGLQFQTHLVVAHSNHMPLQKQLLLASQLQVETSFFITGPDKVHSFQNILPLSLGLDGIATVKLTIPLNISTFNLVATYTDGTNYASSSLSAIKFNSLEEKYLQIETSTLKAKAGQYAIFHVRANFFMTSFFYTLSSKGLILLHDEIQVKGLIHSITTFSISLSKEMCPLSKLNVYHVTSDGKIISDSIILPVEGVNQAKLSLKLNLQQDKVAERVELIPKMIVGSFIGLSGSDQAFMDIQGQNLLTLNSVQMQLFKSENEYEWKHIIQRDAYGKEQKLINLPLSHNNLDNFDAFHSTDTLILSNLFMYDKTYCQNSYGRYTQYSRDNRNITVTELIPIEKYRKCASQPQCISQSKWCDGNKDCLDGSDEQNCLEFQMESFQLLQYLLYRKSRNFYFYDFTSNDFAWQNIFTGNFEDNYVQIYLPYRPTNWLFNAIGMSEQVGLSILSPQLLYTSIRPFEMIVEAPDVISLGEQIALQIAIINNQFEEIQVLISLESSADYRFIQIETDGYVTAYKARTESKILQHLIFLPKHGSKLVPIPIVAQKIGMIKVNLVARCRIGQVYRTLSIQVMAPGLPVYLYTSMMLDMRKQGELMKYLDINVTEEAEIPFQIEKRFIQFSPEAMVTVLGDVVGIVSLNANNDNIMDYSNLDISQAAESAELFAFNFGYHLYSAKYLRKIGQLDHEQMRKWTSILTQDYVELNNYFYQDCCFTMFNHNSGSVWLNAHIANLYGVAQDVEWQEQLYIDGALIKKAVQFVLKHQLENGAFQEKDYNPDFFKIYPAERTGWKEERRANSTRELQSVYEYFANQLTGQWRQNSWEQAGASKPPSSGGSKPPNSGGSKPPNSGASKPPNSGASKPPNSGASKPPNSGASKPPNSGASKPPTGEETRANTFAYRSSSVALTAHVLISLCNLHGQSGAQVDQAKRKASTFLEQNLHSISSMFELAISTYALLLANRVAEANTGVQRLMASERHLEDMIYWAERDLTSNQVKHEAQRTFSQHRSRQRFDTESVLATSYALLVYIKCDLGDRAAIVKYLSYMRTHQQAMLAAHDTLIAIISLVEFSLSTEFRSNTQFDVRLQPSSWPGKQVRFRVEQRNCTVRNSLRLRPHVWGHITVLIRGSGLGLVQMLTSYNVDRQHLLTQPTVQAFHLDVRYLYSGRNHSMLQVQACARWLLTNESWHSDQSILELDIPTGYLQAKRKVDEYVDSNIVRNLRRARLLPRSVVFMFDRIYGNEKTCVQLDMERWFPVANSTKWLRARIYEQSRPELFNVQLIENYVLNMVDICRVCGSYQCQYCPQYSASQCVSVDLFPLFVIYIVCWIRLKLNSANLR